MQVIACVSLLLALQDGGAPPAGAVFEVVAIAAVAFGIAANAIGRTDDGRGGRVGGAAAMVLYLSVYLPPRWWIPMTARPESTRLLVITALGLGLWFAASTDPAMRTPLRVGRPTMRRRRDR